MKDVFVKRPYRNQKAREARLESADKVLEKRSERAKKVQEKVSKSLITPPSFVRLEEELDAGV